VTATEFLRKADAALASAKRDLDANDLDGAANRRYYAMFHAARAALVSIGEPAQGSHGTIIAIAQFGLQFCRDGPLPIELGRAINEAQELRAEGDYGAGTPDATEVAAYLAKAQPKAQQFVAAVMGIVSGTMRGSSR
jgi:uncharacterized protein (UPF0332 family)